jgi:hypothetical protein
MLELMYDLMMDDKMAQSSKVVREPDGLLMFLCTKLTSKIRVSRHLGKQFTFAAIWMDGQGFSFLKGSIEA